MSYPLRDNDRYMDKSKDTFKSVVNGDVSTDSDGKVDDMYFLWK